MFLSSLIMVSSEIRVWIICTAGGFSMFFHHEIWVLQGLWLGKQHGEENQLSFKKQFTKLACFFQAQLLFLVKYVFG